MRAPADAAGRALEALSMRSRPRVTRVRRAKPPSEFLASFADPDLPPEVLGEAGIVVRTFELARFGEPGRRPDEAAVGRAHMAARPGARAHPSLSRPSR